MVTLLLKGKVHVVIRYELMDKSSFSEYMLITKKLIEWSIKDMMQ